MKDLYIRFLEKSRNLFQNVFPWRELEFRKFVVFALGAILLRIIIMPFFGHIDFLSECRRIFHAYDTGSLYPGSRFVTSFVQLINFTVFAPVIAEKSSMFQLQDWSSPTASFIQYFGFADHHAIYRAIFLLKMPFLFFDMATSIVLYHFYQNRKTSLRVSFLWFFNPITIFAFYIYGRYEAVALFFVAATLLALKHNRLLLSFTLLGIVIWSREFYLILFPLFVIYLFRCTQFSWFKKGLAVLIVLFFAGMAANVFPEKMGFVNDGKELIVAYDQAEQFLGFPLVWYYPLIIVYSLIGFWMFLSERVHYNQFVTSLGLFFCAFYALATHSVHYVSWATVVFVVLAGENKGFNKGFWLFCFCWFVFWLIGTDLGVFTQWLAIPFSLYWVNLPILPQFVDSQILSGTTFNIGHVNGALRSVYFASLLFCSIQLLKNDRKEVL